MWFDFLLEGNKNMTRRYILIGLVVVVIVGILALRSCGQSELAASLASLQTEKISRGSLTASVGATGTVRANQAAVLAYQSSGIVDYVAVELGEVVRQGEVLSELQQTSLPAGVILAEADYVAAQRALEDLLESSQAQAAAQLAVAEAQDALDNAEYIRTVRQEGYRASSDTLAAARANLVLAQEEVNRAEADFERFENRPEDDPGRALALSNLIAARKKRDSIQRDLNWYKGHPSEVEQALMDANVAMAEAQLADAMRDWERVKDGPNPDDVVAAEARLAAAEATLKTARIEAPFSGTITYVEVKPGDQVSPGTVAFGLADLSRLLVDVEISEVDINRIGVGQPVNLNFDAILDQTYSGEVTAIGLSGLVTQGVVSFNVTVELKDADERIKPGMTAAVNIVVDQIEDVLLVPNRAVRVVDGERTVFVLEGQEITAVTVVLGVSSDTYSQILDGELKEGDLIILNPPTNLMFNGHPGFIGG
jgi:HlyD family secretion protein